MFTNLESVIAERRTNSKESDENVVYDDMAQSNSKCLGEVEMSNLIFTIIALSLIHI